MASRKAEKERLRQERLARERELAAASRRRRMMQLYGVGGAAVVVAAIVVVLVLGGSGSGSSGSTAAPKLTTVPTKALSVTLHKTPPSGPLGPEGIPIPQGVPVLAPNTSSDSSATVDGIQCAPLEKLVYHIHTHLTVFVNGAQRLVPYGIGIDRPYQLDQTATGPFVAGGSCFHWLHTHASDGIIHVESPTVRRYTLGNFFDIWHQPLGPNQVGPAKGKVTAFYNGQVYKGDPRNIPLGDHAQVQLEVGTPLIAPEKVSFAGSGL